MNKKFEWPTINFVKPVVLIDVLQIDKFNGMDNKVMPESFNKEIICNIEILIIHKNILPFDTISQWKISPIKYSFSMRQSQIIMFDKTHPLYRYLTLQTTR